MISVKNKLIENENFKFIGLGGSNEVGRSCHIIEFKGKTIMLDAGIHPAYRGMLSLPFYDLYDLSKVDVSTYITLSFRSCSFIALCFAKDELQR
ncbi:unnamed protein product [Hanseniaspora opuntiae]